MNSELSNGSNQENPKIEPQNSTMNPSTTPTTTPSEGVLAWRKMMDESSLSPQEKIEATKALMKLRQVQEKNKALLDKLGLGHNGLPLDRIKELNPGKLK
jgi:hypothetical protein